MVLQFVSYLSVYRLEYTVKICLNIRAEYDATIGGHMCRRKLLQLQGLIAENALVHYHHVIDPRSMNQATEVHRISIAPLLHHDGQHI